MDVQQLRFLEELTNDASGLAPRLVERSPSVSSSCFSSEIAWTRFGRNWTQQPSSSSETAGVPIILCWHAGPFGATLLKTGSTVRRARDTITAAEARKIALDELHDLERALGEEAEREARVIEELDWGDVR